MTDIEDLAAKAGQLAATDDLDAMVQELGSERRFRLQAAFGYAKRREFDERMRRAADLLELALAVRTGALSPPRWWQRVEIALGVLLAVNAANLSLQAGRLAGWGGVAALAALLGVSVLLVLVWRRAVRRGRLPVPDLPGAPPSSGRIAEIGEQVLQAGRRAVSQDSQQDDLLDLLLHEARRVAAPSGALAHPLAVGGLAYAQRILFASWEPGREALIKAAEQARQELASTTRL